MVNDYTPLPHPCSALSGRCGVLARASARRCGIYGKDGGMQKRGVRLQWKNLEWTGGVRGYDIGSSKGFWVARERPPFWSEPPASGFIQTLPGLNSRVPDRLRVCSAVVSTTFTIMIYPFFLLSCGLWVCFCAICIENIFILQKKISMAFFTEKE